LCVQLQPQSGLKRRKKNTPRNISLDSYILAENSPGVEGIIRNPSRARPGTDSRGGSQAAEVHLSMDLRERTILTHVFQKSLRKG